MSLGKGCLCRLGGWRKKWVSKSLAFLPSSWGSGAWRRLRKGTDGEGTQRDREGGCRHQGSLQPRSGAGLLAVRGKASSGVLAGPVLLPGVGELAVAAETQKPQPPPCPCCLPHASCSFHGAPLPIYSSFLDSWPFCFCLVTIEGTFQLPRNVLKERADQGAGSWGEWECGEVYTSAWGPQEAKGAAAMPPSAISPQIPS